MLVAGIVIMMVDEKMEPAVCKNMIKVACVSACARCQRAQGEADPLNSSFHLGYNMLLNLLRVEEAGRRLGSSCAHMLHASRPGIRHAAIVPAIPTDAPSAQAEHRYIAAAYAATRGFNS